jgi:Tn7-like transposition protein D/TniQ
MLGFLPRSGTDKLVYSVLARYRLLAGSKFSAPTLTSACGENVRSIDIGMLGRLRHLADILLGVQWTAERLALEQTLFPYCERFASPLRRHRMISGLMEGWKGGSSGVLNSNWSQVTVHPSLNFCPGCVTSDQKALGMSAWHRVHQLPAVFVCPGHGKRLRTTGVLAKQQIQLIECPTEPQAGEAIEMLPGLLAAKSVAKNSLWLLRNPGPPSDPVTLRAGVGAMLRDAGWIGKANKVRPELGQAVAEQLGAEKLAQLGCRIEHQRKWFRWAWEQRATLRMHPLQYLLLLAFLERDAADLFTFAGKPLLDDPPVSLKRPDVGPRSLLNRAFIIQNRVLLEMKSRPDLTRTDIRKLHSTHYLATSDKNWLEASLPPRLRKVKPRDWTAYDLHLLSQIEAAVLRLRARPVPPKRITIKTIVAQWARDT